MASSPRDAGRHRGGASGARGVPAALAREYPGLILGAGSSPEQRWTTADPARDNHDGETRRRRTEFYRASVRGRCREPVHRLVRGRTGLLPAPRGGLRGREASARDLGYFFFTSTPALPEETLLACTANWYVVDCVGGVKPISVPGSYLTDRM